MIVLGFDTATPRTAVALQLDGDEAPREAVHDPAPGERPGHATQLLPLAARLLAEAGLGFADVELLGRRRRARGRSRACASAWRPPARSRRPPARPGRGVLARARWPTASRRHDVLAVIDARRGEAFVAGFRDGAEVLAPAALGPDALERVAPPAGGGTW